MRRELARRSGVTMLATILVAAAACGRFGEDSSGGADGGAVPGSPDALAPDAPGEDGLSPSADGGADAELPDGGTLYLNCNRVPDLCTCPLGRTCVITCNLSGCDRVMCLEQSNCDVMCGLVKCTIDCGSGAKCRCTSGGGTCTIL